MTLRNLLFTMSAVASLTLTAAVSHAIGPTCESAFEAPVYASVTLSPVQPIDLEIYSLNLRVPVNGVVRSHGLRFVNDIRSSEFKRDVDAVLASQPTTFEDIVSRAETLIVAPDLAQPLSATRVAELAQLKSDPKTFSLYKALVAIAASKSVLKKPLILLSAVDSFGKTQFIVARSSSTSSASYVAGDGAQTTIQPVAEQLVGLTLAPTSLVLKDASTLENDARVALPIDFGGNVGVVNVSVGGRSPSERRFKQEDDLIAAAADSDLVPVEWLFAAQFPHDGHTALRIGNTAVEFSSAGMQIHGGGGSDSARAYIFNNPALAGVYAENKDHGSKPFSVGVSFKMPKSKVMAFLALAKSYQERGEPNFNIWVNNCNQCVVRLLEQAEFADLDLDTAFQRFSSVLTFIEVIQSKNLKDKNFFLYPIAMKDEEAASLREFMPTRLTQPRGQVAEIVETIRRMAKTKIRNAINSVRGAPAPEERVQ